MSQAEQRQQRGFTLIELMVSITIGLLVVLGITQVYMSGFMTQRTQDDVSRLNETSRFASELVARELRKAGFRNTFDKTATNGTQEFCAATSAGSALVALNDPLTVNPATANFSGGTAVTVLNKSDVVRSRFYGEDATTTSPLLDCHGYPVAANQLVEDTLYVAADPNNNNEPTLFCNTTNPTPATTTHPGKMALVAGVESLQILYGDDTNNDGIVNRYVPANLLTSTDTVLLAKVSVVSRSPNTVTADAPAKVFNHFSDDQYQPAANSDTGAVFNAPADRRLRQISSTEVAVRNFAYCQ